MPVFTMAVVVRIFSYMKRLITVFLVLGCCNLNAQSWSQEWNTGFVFTSPTGGMKETIRNGSGIVFDFHALSPSKRYSVGAEVNYTVYGFDQSTQKYDFPDGTSADMDVDVTNAFTNLVAVGRFYLKPTGFVLPYVNGKAGYSWYRTNLSIYDPDDMDQCKPLEKDLLYHDGTFIVSAGGGFRFDVSYLFKRSHRQTLYVDLSANYTAGNRVSYMNTDGPDPSKHTSMNARTDDVMASFINTQTQIVHKHHVGYLYSGVARMVDFRLTFVFRPAGLKF